MLNLLFKSIQSSQTAESFLSAELKIETYNLELSMYFKVPLIYILCTEINDS